MRKLRLYLDTSVISCLDVPKQPVQEAATKAFYHHVKEKTDEIELIVSPVLLFELENCPEPKRSQLFSYLKGLKYIQLPENEEALELADLYVEAGVLSARHFRDLTHIAYAVLAKCDYIVSWNFNHFTNIRTISRVNDVNQDNRYPSIDIVPPPFITGEDGYDRDDDSD